MCVYGVHVCRKAGVDIVELEDWQQRAPVPADWTRHLNWMLVRRALFYHQTFCHTFCPWDSVTHQSRPGTAYVRLLSEADHTRPPARPCTAICIALATCRGLPAAPPVGLDAIWTTDRSPPRTIWTADRSSNYYCVDLYSPD